MKKTLLLSFFLLMVTAGCQYSEKDKNRSLSPKKMATEEEKKILKIATFAGGCFWCSESDFEKHDGVAKVISGYIGETEKNISYESVSSGTTGLQEGIQVWYNPEKIKYEELLDIFWRHIDPTDDGGQFADRGTQYRTGVFYHTKEEKIFAEISKKNLNNSGKFKQKITTEILPFSYFTNAEEYHQDYYKKKPKEYHQYREGSGRNEFIRNNWKSSDPLGKTKRDVFSKPPNGILQEKLTDLQYHVTQEDGTEVPFQNEYWDNKKEGIYVDVVSGEPLYSSTDKFKSGTGWPSFTKSLVPENIVKKVDNKLLAPRTEVRSKKSDSHLGHIFSDGPEPTGLRHCINSASLRFIPKENLEREGYEEFVNIF